MIIYANIPKFMLALSVLPLFLYTLSRCVFPTEKRLNAEYVTFMDFVRKS